MSRMGLFDKIRGIKDPVEGTYRLVACSYASGGATYENCTMDGVVEAPGLTPTPVHHVSLITPVAKWPSPGSVLPVTVDRANPTRMKIRWDAVPTTAQIAMATAARQAQLLAQQQQAQQAAQQAADPYAPPSYGTPPAPVGPPTQATPMLPQDVAAMLGDVIARARANGADITTNVTTSMGGRPVPGATGGGLTPAETAQALAGGAAALGLITTTARVLAAHRVTGPGADAAPGGTWDLTLDIDGGNTDGWTSVLRIGFSSDTKRQTIAAVGRTLPVLADPQHHDRIAIDTNRLT